MNGLAFWLPVLLLPYLLGPIVVWLTQRWSVRPDFERFDAMRHQFDADLNTGFQQSRRFYAFCPDIVDQGTETMAALVDELRRSRHLYCWWD